MKKAGIFIIYMLILFNLIGCKNTGAASEVYAAAEDNYIDIVSVDNLLFSIPLYISNAATAVTQITDDMDYASNLAYSYKDGSNTYILFCMDELVIIAAKGTSFHFADNLNKETCLSNSSLVNTWFKKDNKKFSYVENKTDHYYKLIADVSAEVVITTELYGDYCGKLAVIETNDEEWSLFAGVIAKNTNSFSQQQNNFVNTITKSMTLYNSPEKKEPDYDVVINQNFKTSNSTPIETVNQSASNQPTVPDADIIITEEANHYSASEESSLAPSPTPARIGMNLNNQKNQKKEIGKAYQSDEYNMLSLGQCGILQCYGLDSDSQPIIRINKVYTGDDAITKIKSFCKSQPIYDYFDPPEGYSWHLAEYDISYQNCIENGYINIRLSGLDGAALVYRGIPIDQRTHDANYVTEKENDCIYQNYCYYAVPNGCREYSLICGDGSPNKENQFLAAYYHIYI